MADTTNVIIGDTGAVGGQPAQLTPVSIPDLSVGAMTTTVPESLKPLSALWIGNIYPVWQQMGLAIPGCGGRLRTAHANIDTLYTKVAKQTQAIMFHQCARVNRWPEMDVLRAMHLCYLDARDYLNTKLVKDSATRPRPTAGGPDTIAFRAFPMPYFGAYVQCDEIRAWGRRMFSLMTLLLTSDENEFAYGFSQGFVNAVAVPLREVYQEMLQVLLKVDPTKITDAYVATDADFATYAASIRSDSNLTNSSVGLDPLWQPSQDDLAWTRGAFSYKQIAPYVAVWPEAAAPAIPSGQTSGSGSSQTGTAASGSQQGAIQTTG